MAAYEEQHFYWLDQIDSADRGLVGDVAYDLAMLARRGYAVWPGLVVSASVFQQFLRQVDWSQPLFADLPDSSLYVDVNNARQLQAIAQQLQQAIRSTPLDGTWLQELGQLASTWNTPSLMLRPSVSLQAAHTPMMTGRIRGLLTAHTCNAELEAIAHGVQQIWTELFRARSLFYWQRSRIPLNTIRLAVLIQPIPEAIASGAVHTHPTHTEIWAAPQSKLVASGSFLPPLAASDLLAPDYYWVDAATGEVEMTHAGLPVLAFSESTSSEFVPPLSTPLCAPALASQPSINRESDVPHPILSADQIHTLEHTARRIADDLGRPVELEWCLSTGRDGSNLMSILQVTQRHPATQPRMPAFSIAPIPSAEHVSSSRPLSSATVSSQVGVLTGLAAAPGRRIGRVLVVNGYVPKGTTIEQILVASSVSPRWLPELQQARGFITEQGGMTSHGAIVARELGIPAVVGVADATRQLKTGDVVCIDGDRGVVIPMSEAALLSQDASVAAAPAPAASPSAPMMPYRPLATQLMVNVSQVEALAQVGSVPINGIGLVRSEHVLLGLTQGRSLYDWQSQAQASYQLAEAIQKLARAIAPSPLFYRSADVRSHERSFLDGTVAEPNPILGLHGTLSYQSDPTLFDLELEALRLAQDAGCTNVRLLLPFVRTVEEFQWCDRRIQQSNLRHTSGFQVWIMAEVPSILFLLPELVAAGVQGISIGSNDLTQLLLAIDRDSPPTGANYSEAHPAVLRAMRQLIQAAHQAEIPCAICGEAPVQHPYIIADLVRWGIYSISVSPAAAAATYQAIAQAEQALLLEAARQTSRDARG
ncbi:putative PEP-binding protein [Leptolyngbya sp. AN02str]|uniref:putative PEP-binding protein n=1 Tax=Leptolyngbya sp. AN02str TaxID=3423363 RepID=UPI003D324245